jgi:hypothetical protein
MTVWLKNVQFEIRIIINHMYRASQGSAVKRASSAVLHQLLSFKWMIFAAFRICTVVNQRHFYSVVQV